MAEIFKVEVISDADQCCELSLPVGDHAMNDAYIRLSQPLSTPPNWSLLRCRGYEYLAPFLEGESLLGVNVLAQRLSAMDGRQQTAFEGITKRELELRRGPFGVEDLLHYAQSVDLCHVVSEAKDDASLGRFYAENGFIPEVGDLSDEVFEMLDFAKIGKQKRKEEHGVFTRNGYVLLHEPINRSLVSIPEQPERPEYVFLLKLEPYPFEDTYDLLQKPQRLQLPASEETLRLAVERLAIGNLDEGLYTIEDSMIPDTLDENGTLVELQALNTLANAISELSQDELIKYKALLDATQCGGIDDALSCVGSLERYNFDSNVWSYEQIAREDISGIISADSADMVIRHLNLDAYGREVAEKEHGFLTPYGYLAHADLEPIVSNKSAAADQRVPQEQVIDPAQGSRTPETHVESEDNKMNWFEQGRQMAEMNKKLYPPGTRIELLSMGNDPRPIEPGTKGTVDLVDDMGTLHCTFDNGRKLGVCLEEDSIRVIREQELSEPAMAEEPGQEPEMGGMSM